MPLSELQIERRWARKRPTSTRVGVCAQPARIIDCSVHTFPFPFNMSFKTPGQFLSQAFFRQGFGLWWPVRIYPHPRSGAPRCNGDALVDTIRFLETLLNSTSLCLIIKIKGAFEVARHSRMTCTFSRPSWNTRASRSSGPVTGMKDLWARSLCTPVAQHPLVLWRSTHSHLCTSNH